MKSEQKERNKQELEEISFIREEKKREKEFKTKENQEEEKKNREKSLLNEHRKVLTRKEGLEKQLEETLEVIMRIREGYKDLDL